MNTVTKFIHRTKKEGNFTQISNDIINDKRLGLKEKALMAYLLSKPDDWQFILKNIIEETGQTRHIVVTALEKLKQYGYIIEKNKKQYIIKENPQDVVVLKDNKTIYRASKQGGKFTQVDNRIIYNKNFSINAKTVIIYMLSKPDDWRFYTTVIEEDLTIDRKTLNKALNELEENGYIKREKFGRQYIWHVYEEPIITLKEKSALTQHTTQDTAHYPVNSNYNTNSDKSQESAKEKIQENKKKIDDILNELQNHMQNVVNLGYTPMQQYIPRKNSLGLSKRKTIWDPDDFSWLEEDTQQQGETFKEEKPVNQVNETKKEETKSTKDEDFDWLNISDEEIEQQKKEMEKFWKQVDKIRKKKSE